MYIDIYIHTYIDRERQWQGGSESFPPVKQFMICQSRASYINQEHHISIKSIRCQPRASHACGRRTALARAPVSVKLNYSAIHKGSYS